MDDKKKELIELIDNLTDTGQLEYLLAFVKLYLEKWGQ